MKFAYADPPYPGQAKRWYRDHPDYAGEVNHGELIDRLTWEYPNGWALSTSAAALRDMLILCPSDVRVAIWHVTNSQTPGNRGKWHWCWEALIVRGGRSREPGEYPMRDVLTCPHSGGFQGATIAGQKPPAFCRWVFGLLGALPGDQLDDLFPGSGTVGGEWAAYCAQPWLPAESKPPRGPERAREGRRERMLAREGALTLMDMSIATREKRQD